MIDGVMSRPLRGAKRLGAWPAIVVDNKDGEGNPGYRVKLKFPWLAEQDASFWARIAVPMGGPDRGTYVLPEIDDQVLVVFEHGDINRSIVVGSLWSKKQEPVEHNQSGSNNTKLIKSRSGHRIIFDDADGAEKIVIVDKTKKNKIILDSAHKIIKLESDGDIEVKAKANVVLHSNALKVGTKEGITGKGQSLLVHAAKTFGLKATSGITIGGGSTTINVSNAAATRVSGSGAGELGGAGAEPAKQSAASGGGRGGGGGGGGGAAGAGAAIRAAATTITGASAAGTAAATAAAAAAAAAAAPPPTVQITGSAAGDPAPTVVVIGHDVDLFANATPPGGTFAWSISGARATLASAAGAGTTVHGTTPSARTDDTRVTVRYTTPGGTATASVLLSVLLVQLDADADRDGTVENNNPGKATWTWGSAGAGAVLLPNLDDDDTNGSADASDVVVNGAADVADLVPLVMRRCGPRPLPHGHQLFLVVSDHTKLRIFKSRAAGAHQAIGPATSDEYQIQFPDREQTLGVEATQFPDDSFDGLLDIALVLRDSGGAEVARDSVAMRVAPWMINASHLEAVDKLFVCDLGHPSGVQFQADVSAMASAVGVPLVTHAVADQWMQDCMEIGCASIPGSGMHAVLNMPNTRPLDTFPPTLLGRNVAVIRPVTGNSTFDSGGNFECTPPDVTRVSDGHVFPFGRLYTGPGRSGESNDLLPFLNAQIVQEPFTIDTTWLVVGHVDEVISFVPAATGAKGFKMLIASTSLARSILTSAQAAGNGSSTILTGRFNTDPLIGPGTSTARTIDNVLLDTVLMNFNSDAQIKLDDIRATMKAEIGVTDADIVELPVLYFDDPSFPGLASALTGGVVNMLVANGHAGVCHAFGPLVGGVDLFEADTQTKLSSLGLTIHFIDDWYMYHLEDGEVHCGTNAMRHETIHHWWEFVP